MAWEPRTRQVPEDSPQTVEGRALWSGKEQIPGESCGSCHLAPWGPGHPCPSLRALGSSFPAQLRASQHALPCEPVSFSTPHCTCCPHQEEARICEPWPGLARASTHHLCWEEGGGTKQGAKFCSLVCGLPPPAFHFPRGLAAYVKPLVHAGVGEACPASRGGSGPSPQPALAPCRRS